jgi:protein-S-isoprenylcysteine O-methyltransferase Ste14
MGQRSTGSLLFSSLVFTLLQPGLVAGVFPYWWFSQQIRQTMDSPFSTPQYGGMIIFMMGFMIMMNCIIRFVLEGRGTLSPADPTRKLVVKGLYQYTRNPMYVGVVLMLIGEAVFFGGRGFWIYAAGVTLMFHLFILLVEEPRLKRDFGDEYVQYCRQVKRWI